MQMLKSVFDKEGFAALIAKPGQLCKGEVTSMYVPNQLEH